MSDYDYDLFTVGAGSGGVRASRLAAQYGARVAVAEEYRVGGTCVIRGCIPKKLFVYASHFSEDFEDATGFGWSSLAPSFSWPDLVRAKDKEIDRLNGIYIRNLQNAGVEIVNTRAHLCDRHTVHLVDQNRDVTARIILIATGASPSMPQIPGIEHCITSNEAFHLDKLPGHITIVGGGYIGVEFAGIFHGLGVATTLLYRGDEILRGFDQDLRQGLHKEMVKAGIDVRVRSQPERVGKHARGLTVFLRDGTKLDTGLVMMATGRDPNSQGLGLKEVGVKLDENGAVVVDAYSQSVVENIYAVGDVTDRLALTPVAIREGAAFAETVFNSNPTQVDYDFVPTAVFSQPEIGTVGLSEEKAHALYGELDIYKSVFRPLKHTLSGRDTQMLMKLVVARATERVLGCHILGPDAGEMVQCLGIALKMGATKADFDATMALHPSAAEELVTMRQKYVASAPQAAE
jgi:glutathione reductase (NADPH)